jgi:(1->4)-alpha-D-glucan 1-alpha-D-glucosylmutase
VLAECGCDPESEAFVNDLLAHWPDARIKMFVMACGLRLRRRLRDLFIDGAYTPLRAEGSESSRLVAFARTLEGQAVVAIVPRLLYRVLPEGHRFPVGHEVWKDTRVFLPAAQSAAPFRHVFTGARVKADQNGSLVLADVLRTCPVALLTTD